MTSTKQYRLSSYPTAQAWLAQFDRSAADRAAAESMLNTILLLNEEQVSASIRNLLYGFAEGRKGRHRRAALYAEREFPEKFFFQSRPTSDGRTRSHAFGRVGPAVVKPARGATRVGSEGFIASIISTVVETRPKIFLNNPGPDRIRGKTSPVGAIIIVTDFVGSGERVRTILDAMWAVPTVKSWLSLGLIKFHIVAAAATAAGMTNLRRHRLKPNLIVEYVAPSLAGAGWRQETEWHNLVQNHGPDSGSRSRRISWHRRSSQSCRLI